MKVSQNIIHGLVNSPYLLGRKLWLAMTLVKLILTSYVLVTGASSRYQATLLVTVLVETACLVYLVLDRHVSRKNIFGLMILLVGTKDIGVTVLFYLVKDYGITYIHFLLVAASYIFFNEFVTRRLFIRVLIYSFLGGAVLLLFSQESIFVVSWFAAMAGGLVAIDVIRFLHLAYDMGLGAVSKDYENLK